MRWIEINIGLKSNLERRREVALKALYKLVDPLVIKFKEVMREGCTWHYLWEANPWPLTLRLRFYCNDNVINRIKQEFEKLWSSLKASEPEIFIDYCYGRHGKCGEVYAGEEDIYGYRGWDLVNKMLNFGAEIALELIKKCDIMGKSQEFKASLNVYVDRYVHLFLNQMYPLVDEIGFYLIQLVFRYLYAIGISPNDKIVNELANKILQMLQQEAEKRKERA